MICDSHVHIGYYPRKGYDRPFYYSPRRIVGILDKCGVGEFIVSSTCAQIEEIGVADIVRKRCEMRRCPGTDRFGGFRCTQSPVHFTKRRNTVCKK